MSWGDSARCTSVQNFIISPGHPSSHRYVTDHSAAGHGAHAWLHRPSWHLSDCPQKWCCAGNQVVLLNMRNVQSQMAVQRSCFCIIPHACLPTLAGIRTNVASFEYACLLTVKTITRCNTSERFHRVCMRVSVICSHVKDFLLSRSSALLKSDDTSDPTIAHLPASFQTG